MHTWHEFKTVHHHYWRLRDGNRRLIAELVAVNGGWLTYTRNGLVSSERVPLETAVRQTQEVA